MSQMANVHSAFHSGKVLSDVDVKAGLQFYRKLSEDLMRCGPQFRLAADEANRTANWLEDMAKARKIL